MSTSTDEFPSTPESKAFWNKNYQLHTSWLRSLYCLAEPAFEEHKTSEFIVKILQQECSSLSVSLPFKEAPTAIIAVFEPENVQFQPILLRADMDALRMNGASPEPHRIRPEIYHGCGHNGHVTCLLTAAHYIHCFPQLFHRKVVFLFQPAEESSNTKVVGRKGSGARILLDGGLLSTLHSDVRSVYALHCWPGQKVGDFAIGEGPITATSARFELTFRGSGGHAAYTSSDKSEPLLAACATVTTAPGIITRATYTTDTFTVAFTKVVNSNSSTANICPNEVVVYGTIRSLDDQVLIDTQHLLRRAAQGIAISYGCTVDVVFRKGLPITVNGPNAANTARIAARSVHEGNEERVHSIGLGVRMLKPSLCSDDFSLIAQQRDGAYIWLGNGEENKFLHTTGFLFKEEAVAFGGKFFVEVAKCEDAD